MYTIHHYKNIILIKYNEINKIRDHQHQINILVINYKLLYFFKINNR